MRILHNRSLFIAILCAVPLLLMSCAEQKLVRGHIIHQSELDMIQQGQSTKQDVLQILGTPTVVGQFNPNRFIYMGQKRVKDGFVPAQMKDFQAYIFDFNDAGVLQSIGYYNSDDLQFLAYSDERTLTRGSQLTVMQQLLGNLGRFEAPQENIGVRDLLER